MKHVQHYILLFSFLGIIFCVPITQAFFDITFEDEEKPLFLTLYDKAPTEEHLREFENNLEQSSTYEKKIRPLFQLGRYYALRELGEKALAGKSGWYYYTPGVRYLTEPYYTELTKPPQDDPVDAVVDFSRQLRKKGIELIVIPVPGKASIYPENLASSVKPNLRVSAHTQRFSQLLREKGIDVFNLHKFFIEERTKHPKGPQLYMATDTHWTGHGVRLAAAKLAARIKQHPWFAKLPQVERYTRRQVQVIRRGDVPRMTQIPRQEHLFPEESVTCFRVFDKKTQTPYEDPEDPQAASILLLGDSFSRVFQTDEPEAAGFISNLAYELQQPILSIVNDGGASTLVRQELAQSLDYLEGKKLLIWAFVERDIRFGMQGWQKIDLQL